MQHIGDIMKEMHIALPVAAQSLEAQPTLVARVQSRLQEYSCSQLSEEDYAPTTNPWEEWPYSWVCQLNDFMRHRFHSFHQNHSNPNETRFEEAAGEASEYSEYSAVTAKAA